MPLITTPVSVPVTILAKDKPFPKLSFETGQNFILFSSRKQ